MVDRTSFVQHMLASPNDATLVMQFADWLEEQGDPEAEVIRTYLSQDREDSRRKFGIVRNYDYMADPFPGVELFMAIRRKLGVIFHVQMTMDDLLAQGEFVFANHPVRSLALRRPFKTKPQPGSLSFLESVNELETPVNRKFASIFVDCPHLRNVQALRFEGHRMYSNTVVKLLEEGPWKALSYLAIENLNFDTDAGSSVVDALVSSKSLNDIGRLELNFTLTPAQRALLRARFGPALVTDDF